MSEHFTYIQKGVCSRQMDFDLNEGKIEKVVVTGGCNGNLKGIASLLKGMEINEVIERLDGIKCGSKSSSCPDQIAHALKEYSVSKN